MAVDLYLTELRGAEEDRRAGIARVLGRSGGASVRALDALVGLMKDKSWPVRIAAASRPQAVSVDGEPTEQFSYDAASGQLTLSARPGHALITVR